MEDNLSIIELDWNAALCGVESGTELSADIGWGFTGQDLLVLTCLHEAGLHREKIYDLLEDCNFHRENALLAKGEYDECRAVIINDILKGC